MKKQEKREKYGVNKAVKTDGVEDCSGRREWEGGVEEGNEKAVVKWSQRGN